MASFEVPLSPSYHVLLQKSKTLRLNLTFQVVFKVYSVKVKE